MVDCHPTLCNVHDPRVDQPLRRTLQPHLHLRTLTLGDGVPCRLSQLSEELCSRWIQPRRPRLHTVLRSNLVLPPRRNITSHQRNERPKLPSHGAPPRRPLHLRNHSRLTLPRNIPVPVSPHRGWTPQVPESTGSRRILHHICRNHTSSILPRNLVSQRHHKIAG